MSIYNVIFSFGVGVVVALLSIVINLILSSNITRSYTILVVGNSNTGKTTLISAILNYLRSLNVPDKEFRLRGDTNDRVIENINKMDKGIIIGTTKERFPYEAHYKLIKKSLFIKNYRINLYDFPGTDSERLSNNKGEKFHQTEYFNYATEADVIIFVIDMAREYTQSDNLYSINVNSDIQLVWERICDSYYAGKKNNKIKVLLAVTKSDLISLRLLELNQKQNTFKETEDGENERKKREMLQTFTQTFKEKVKPFEIGTEYPTPIEMYKKGPGFVNVVKSEEGKILKRDKENELITFLTNRAKSYKDIFTSYFSITGVGKDREGIKDIVDFILPK